MRFPQPLSPERLLPLVCTLLLLSGASSSATEEVYEFEETRQLVERVVAAADLIADEGLEIACEAFQTPGPPWFFDEVYVFVLDLDGEALCHPAQPQFQGRSLLEMRDPHGKPVVRNFLAELEGDEVDGWVHYLWPRPGDPTFYWKSTYVRKAQDSEATYVVGSGLYELPTERSFVVEQVKDAEALVLEYGTDAFDLLRERWRGFRFLDAYLFVMEENGIEHVNLGFPELEGLNLLDFQDTTGKLVSREMLRRLEDYEDGWIEYQWPRPGQIQPSAKSSYVRGVEVEGTLYVIGAGVYLPSPP